MAGFPRAKKLAHKCADKRAHSDKHAHADTHVETQMRKDTYIQAHIHVYTCKFKHIYINRKENISICML